MFLDLGARATIPDVPRPWGCKTHDSRGSTRPRPFAKARHRVRRGYVDLEHALEVPYRMVLGVFTFIVLCRDRVARLFARAR
jgi:hypothetical protein